MDFDISGAEWEMTVQHLSLLSIAALSGAALLMSGSVAAKPAAGKKPAGAAKSSVAANGEAIFRQHCRVCHSLEPGKQSSLGPNLRGVVGRKAGSTGFRYSAALADSGITWTREQLDKYLTAPMKTVPGTRMVVSLPDEARRRAVIDYLAETGAGE